MIKELNNAQSSISYTGFPFIHNIFLRAVIYPF
jgi:hypothetical protein